MGVFSERQEWSLCVLVRIRVKQRVLSPILVALTVGAAVLLPITLESGTAAAVTFSRSSKPRPAPRIHDRTSKLGPAIEGMRPGIETAMVTEMHLSRSWAQEALDKLPERQFDPWIHRVLAWNLKQQVRMTDHFLQMAANKRLDSRMRRLLDRFQLWMLRRNVRSKYRIGAKSAASTEEAIAWFKDDITDDQGIRRGRAILSGKDEQGKRQWFNIIESDGNTMVHDAQARDQESGRGYFYPLSQRRLPKLSDVKITMFDRGMDAELGRMAWQEIVATSMHPDSAARR